MQLADVRVAHVLDESLVDDLNFFIQRQLTHFSPLSGDLVKVNTRPELRLNNLNASWSSFEFLITYFRRELID